ncbi:unnamed protein product [Clonostachys rosea]|uniref:F-box domain-containing protein n=1 Tax=Bionectria ochroleuca TaxID=29856 RepID=A0ABY6UXH3_BIOOC|nr:unnamed protein product [Clonostachys rosea]
MAPFFLELPMEILNQISSALPNSALKELRLTCSFAHTVFRLRFNRVFLSRNKHDLDVFFQVANSETFRHQIVELVWDQSRFCLGKINRHRGLHNLTPFESQYELATELVRFQRDRVTNTGCFTSDDPLFVGGYRISDDCLARFYKSVQLGRETGEQSDHDALALEHNIHRFPSLRRITISHATNGWLFEPFYETPLVRKFPFDFLYSVERSDLPIEPVAPSIPAGALARWGGYSKATHGYRAVFKALAVAKQLQIEELVIETPGGISCGIPYDFFMLGMTSDYLNFIELLRRPQLRRFDLAITTWDERISYQNASHLPKERLKAALREAGSLTHFSFKMNTKYYRRSVDYVPLQALLPVHSWTNLQHFELSHLTVRQRNLANILSALPQSVRSVELSFLHFARRWENFAGLLDEIREKVSWDKRDAEDRPRLCISLRVSGGASTSIAIRVDTEIDNFLYKQGLNPFRGSRAPDGVELGVGTERDVFNPEYEWPRDKSFDWDKKLHQAKRWLSGVFELIEERLINIAEEIELKTEHRHIGELEPEDEESDVELEDEESDG